MKNKILLFTAAGFPFIFKHQDFKDLNIKVPSTKDITEELCNKEFYVRDSRGEFRTLKPGDLIFNEFERQGRTVNFEGIINALESLIDYYEGIETNNEVNILFIIKDVFEEKLNFANKLNDKIIFGFKQGENINTALHPKILINGSGILTLLKNIYADFLGVISEKIQQYNNPLREKLENEQGVFPSNILSRYYKALNDENIVRHYSLNYDNTFHYMFGDEYYNGFDMENPIQEHKNSNIEIFELDNNKFRKNRDKHCNYNLHGSIFMINSFSKSMHSSRNEKPIFYRPSIASRSYHNSYKGDRDANPNETIPFSPIITGHRKSQRVLLEPFIYFLHEFVEDIYSVNKIVIMGYSFGDPYINRLFNIASERVPSIDIDIVDKFNVNNDEQLKKYIGSIPWGNIQKINIKDYNETGFIRHENTRVFFKGVEDYLEKELSKT